MICPYCGKNVNKEDKDAIKNTIKGLDLRRYYHLECHQKAKVEPKEEWPEFKRKSEEDEGYTLWTTNMYDYLLIEQRIIPDMVLIKVQTRNFMRKGMRPKGMYNALRYFYEVVKKDAIDKSNGGIGIVPHVYEDARAYWENRQLKEHNIVEQINNQIEQMEKKKTILLKKKKKIKKGMEIDWDEIFKEEE